MTFADRYGPWAVIAGASEGLGAALAREVAARGVNVLLVARREGPLADVAAGITQVQARTLVLDLGAPDLAERLAEAIAGLDVGLLVYNAALSPIGPFTTTPLADKLRALDVNARGPLICAHVVANGLVARGQGGILLISSLSGLWGTALISTYAATKAFDTVLAEGLWDELRDHGVDAHACLVGPTRTPGYERSNPKAAVAPAEPEDVARAALDGLGRGPSRAAGWRDRLARVVLAALPRRVAVATMGRATRAMYLPGPR